MTDRNRAPGAQDEERSFEKGSAGVVADAAVSRAPEPRDRASEAPHARPAPDGDAHDQLAPKLREGESRQDALVDEAVEETFPASDPISPKHIT